MNYLAHLHLADQTPDSLLGNVLADCIKGNELSSFPPSICTGVLLHRQVDSFTDRHPVVQRSICRISRKWGWFSGILIDVYYDHVLARDWLRYAIEPLRHFVDRVHLSFLDGIEHVPVGGELLRRLIASDRLYSYVTTAGIADALLHLSHRINQRMPHKNIHLEQAMDDLLENHDDLVRDFHEFYPNLIEFAASWKEANKPSAIAAL